MIVISGALVLVAAVLLVLGIVSSITLVYAAIGLSIVSAVFLLVGVFQRPPVASEPREAVGGDTKRQAPQQAPKQEPRQESAPPSQEHDEPVEADATAEFPLEAPNGAFHVQSAATGADVLVISGRPRYHVGGCEYVEGHDDSEPLPITEARELGFTPCGTCRPDETLARGAAGHDGAQTVSPGAGQGHNGDHAWQPQPPQTQSVQPQQPSAPPVATYQSAPVNVAPVSSEPPQYDYSPSGAPGGNGASPGQASEPYQQPGQQPEPARAYQPPQPPPAAQPYQPAPAYQPPSAPQTAPVAQAAPPVAAPVAAVPPPPPVELPAPPPPPTPPVAAAAPVAATPVVPPPAAAAPEPVAEPATAPTTASQRRTGRTVAAVAATKVYHRADCELLADAQSEDVTKVSAIRLGYLACGVCKP